MSVERDLRTLAAGVDWPQTPALADVVAARLTSAEPRRTPRRRVRLALVAVAVLVAAFGAVLALSPGARSALLDFLRIGGAQVTRVDELPDEAEWRDLALGELVAVDEARWRTGLPVRLPAGVDDPQVYVDDTIAGGGAWVAWCCDPRLLLLQARGQSTPFVEKLAGRGTHVEYVTVDGGVQGAWLSGEPHAVFFTDARGRTDEHRLRLAGNVLLWERDGITYRLEGARTLAQALEVAGSLR